MEFIFELKNTNIIKNKNYNLIKRNKLNDFFYFYFAKFKLNDYYV